jgi:hypothetical protein
MKTPRIVLLLSGLLAALATSKAPIDSGDSDPDDTAVAATCANTAVESCEDQGCALIRARELQDDGDGGVCVDWSDETVPKGCMDADLGCAEAEALAAPADDPTDCWWFSNLCLPEGWVSCESTEYGECS